jgi:hypothetical protein
VAVNRKIPRFFAYIIRTTIFFPFLLSWAAASLIWSFGLDPTFGVIDHYAGKLGFPQATLLSSTWALVTLIIIDLWNILIKKARIFAEGSLFSRLKDVFLFALFGKVSFITCYYFKTRTNFCCIYV